MTPLAPLPLWPDLPPGALGREATDIPTLIAWLPPRELATGAALVIFAGGGYGGISAHEAAGYAQWLCAHGIAGFVARYRLGTHGYRHPAMLLDAHRAVRLAREKAAGWNLDRSRIGVIGSSAGGHLAATLLARCDAGLPDADDPVERHASRPDLAVLCYPVITMGPRTHPGSRKNLLGDAPSDEIIHALSNEFHVRADSPPCFIWHTWEDASVPVENSLEYAGALRRKGIPCELHVYEQGIHGMGLGNLKTPEMHRWTLDCLAWLRERGYAR